MGPLSNQACVGVFMTWAVGVLPARPPLLHSNTHMHKQAPGKTARGSLRACAQKASGRYTPG